jgi:multidrug resistance protein, MATE family
MTAPAMSFRILLALAWPIVLARSAQAVIGFSDALMTAPLGEEPVAAVTTGSMNTFSALIFPMGIVFIVQSFAAQLKARGDLRAARRYAYYGLALAVAAMLVAIAVTPLIGPTLGLLDYSVGVRTLMTDYLVLRAWSVGAVVATEVIGNWYGGLGNTRLHMVAGIVAMVFNVALNWLLIEGNLGAPALGVSGAAIASVIASWVGFGILALCFFRRWFIEHDVNGPLELRWSELWRMLRFGVPNGLNWFLEFSAFAVFVNVVVAHLGTSVLAAMMIVMNVNSISFMPAFGLASAGAILVGQAIGSGDHDRVAAITGRTLVVTASWQGLVGLGYLLAPEWVMGLFAQSAETAHLFELGAVLLAISAAWQLFDAVVLTLGESLRAAGDTAWSMWVRVAMAWLGFVPAAYVAVYLRGGGHVAAMLCILGYMAALGLALTLRFRSGAWRRIDLVGEPALV